MPAATAPEKPVEKTPEQLAAEAKAAEAAKPAPQEVINEFFAEVVTPAKPKEKGDEKPPKPARPTVKKPDPKPAARPPKPASKPAREPEPAPALNAEELAVAVGKGVADAMAARQPEKPADAPDALAGLTEEEQQQVPVMAKMEAMYPGKYKGIKDKYVSNAKAVNEYKSAWEVENPDKPFDPEDTEHDKFFAKHTLDWNENDEMRAQAKLIAEEEVAAVRNSTQSELEALRQRERAREAEPTIANESLAIDRAVFNLFDGEFKNILDANGAVNAEVIKKIESEDPIAYEMVLPEVLNLRKHGQELIRLDRGLVKFDKANPMHAFIGQFATRQEAEILALPKAQQEDAQGKKYATSAEWRQMTPQQRTKHWTLTSKELNALMAAEFGAGLKKRVDAEKSRQVRLAEKLGFVKGEKSKPAGAKPGDTPAPETDDEVESPENTPVRTHVPGSSPQPPTPQNAAAAFFDIGK
jgi:hypothetical protein